MKNTPPLLTKGFTLATESLRQCYDENLVGIRAGKNQFADFWARDSFFASIGSLKLKDYEIVKNNILLFTKHQNRNGQIPLRISDTLLEPGFMGLKIKTALTPHYHQHVLYSVLNLTSRKVYPIDSNSLYIITCANYLSETKDIGFIKNISNNITLAARWNKTQTKYGLLNQLGYADWMDSINKEGLGLYANVLYWKSLVSLNFIYTTVNKAALAKETQKESQVVKKSIDETFWNGKFYADSAHNGLVSNIFSVDGNLLGCMWNLYSPIRKRKILSYYSSLGLQKPVPSRTNFPEYKSKAFFPLVKIAGIAGYHNNGFAWLWLGAISAIAFRNINKGMSLSILNRLSTIISNSNGVHEIYGRDNKPVKRLFYKAEVPFAWSAGLIVASFKELKV